MSVKSDVELLEHVLRDRLLDHGPHARRKHRVVFENMHEQAARARTQERAIVRLETAGLAFADPLRGLFSEAPSMAGNRA